MNFGRGGSTGKKAVDVLEEQFKLETIGLVTRAEFIEKRKKYKDSENEDKSVVPVLRGRDMVRKNKLSFVEEIDDFNDNIESCNTNENKVDKSEEYTKSSNDLKIAKDTQDSERQTIENNITVVDSNIPTVYGKDPTIDTQFLSVSRLDNEKDIKRDMEFKKRIIQLREEFIQKEERIKVNMS